MKVGKVTNLPRASQGTMSRTVSLYPVTNIERQRTKTHIERIASSVERSKPEHDSFCNAAQVFLSHQAKVPGLSTVPNDALNSLPLAKVVEVYWQEIDQIIDWVRACVFNLIHAGTLSVIESGDNLVLSAMHLRQLMEVCIWAVYYQYGQTTAFNIASRMYRGGKLQQGFYFCGPLEDLVRGAVAPDPERVEGFLRVISDEKVPTPLPEEHIGEIRAAFVKQTSVARHVAETFDKVEATNIARRLLVIERAYNLCCGLIHPTPLLFQVAGQGVTGRGQSHEALSEVLFETLHACYVLVLKLYFDRSFEAVRFWPFFRELLPRDEEAKMVDLNITQLRDMKKVYSPIEFSMANGKTRVIFDQNKRKKQES